MRVTNGMVINTSLNGLYNNMNAINKTYAQMTTGKKIQTVSDDPIIAGRALKLKTTVLETSQYESNTKEAMSWMEVTESSLDNITEILKSIRTKCVQASTGTLTKEDKAAIKTDIGQLWKQLQEEANTTYGGRYIFSGYKTNDKLIIEEENADGSVTTLVNPNMGGGYVGATEEEGEYIDGAYESGTQDQKIEYEIGVGTTIVVNTTGMDEVLTDIKSCLEHMMKTVDDSLEEGSDITVEDLNNMFTKKLDQIDSILKKVSQKTSDLGSRMSRVEYTQERLADNKITFKNILSETEDVDIEEVYTNFNVQYATYQSALQATAKIITNTLADYL